VVAKVAAVFAWPIRERLVPEAEKGP
jgi:hypothetical protein